MQKLRDPNTLKGAIAKIIEELGREYCGEITGLRERQLYNYSDPDSDQLPNLAKAIALDRAFTQLKGEPGPILQAYQHKVAAIKAPPHEPEEPLQRITKTMKEVSEGIERYGALVKAGKASPNCLLEVERELVEAAEQIEGMRKDARALYPVESKEMLA